MSGKVQGYALVIDPDPRRGGLGQVEYDTKQCGHCQAVIFTKPGTASTVYLIPVSRQPGKFLEEPGAGCRVCMRAICLPCCDLGVCTPWERQMEQMEAKDRFKRSV